MIHLTPDQIAELRQHFNLPPKARIVGGPWEPGNYNSFSLTQLGEDTYLLNISHQDPERTRRLVAQIEAMATGSTLQ